MSAPADLDDKVLTEELTLFDVHRNRLVLSVHYETLNGCVHAFSLIAPYWVLNSTGLPLQMRELGAKHGFGGDEPPVVREVVCENQRRRTLFNEFSATGLFPTDYHGPFSDEQMQRKHASLAGIWLPTGWVWLDDAWRLDTNTGATDTHGWAYATNWSTGWTSSSSPLTFVRRRRWVRLRARVTRLTPTAVAMTTDEAIQAMSPSELRQVRPGPSQGRPSSPSAPATANPAPLLRSVALPPHR